LCLSTTLPQGGEAYTFNVNNIPTSLLGEGARRKRQKKNEEKVIIG